MWWWFHTSNDDIIKTSSSTSWTYTAFICQLYLNKGGKIKNKSDKTVFPIVQRKDMEERNLLSYVLGKKMQKKWTSVVAKLGPKIKERR